MDKISTEKQNKKPGRKPIYAEERVKFGIRIEKSFVEDLAKLIELLKQENPDVTQNEYVSKILKEQVSYELFRLTKKK